MATQADVIATIFILYLLILIFTIPYAILTTVCQWHLFAKAGKEGWKCLIPVYGQFVAFKLFWNTGWFVASIVISIISGIISFIAEPTGVISAMSFVVGIFSLILSIRYTIMLSRAFGRSGKFAVGLIFLPIVFLPMLAFGPDKYIGPCGVPASESGEPFEPEMPDPSEAIEENIPMPELPKPLEGTEDPPEDRD